MTCTATNSAGVSASASTIVTVRDTKAPKLEVSGHQKVEATGANGAIVSYAVSATDLVDGSVPVSCAPASGSVFPIGSTSVSCRATDKAGNARTEGFNVTVHDRTAPSIVSVTPSVSTLPATGQMVPVTFAGM